ncbi:MAG TPA: hypothetical protein VLB47_11775, partial [Solirubrobacteraceae bacterium]|nr:hypothetical protein [Solirubrobacteraceae bacterium]
MTRRRMARSGLRWKLGLALVATSAVTLAAAMLAIVHPLESRLEADQLHALRQLARTTRLAVDGLPPRELHRGSVQLDRLARSIERRTGARIAVFDPGGAALVDPDARAARDADSAALTRHGDVRDGVVDGAAVVALSPVGPRNRLTIVLRKPLRDQRAAASVVRGALPVAAGVGLLVALLLAAALSNRLLRRLERLRRDARRLADEGIE